MDAKMWRGVSIAFGLVEQRFYDLPPDDRWVRFMGAPEGALEELRAEARRYFLALEASQDGPGAPLVVRAVSWDHPVQVTPELLALRRVAWRVAERLSEAPGDAAAVMECAADLRDACAEVGA